MKKPLLLFLLLYSFASLYSQNIPEIKLDKGTISVKKLKVKVEIVGDIAITTYDMSFYNPTDRVLEGELNFPLGENQSVTRFALDIDGTLREAVVVEKEKARVAFETTVRAKIDPALLEQTKGNNYKARIYPIPNKGYKRVVLAYQQKLILNEDFYYYKIPFSFKKKLEQFSLSINVLNQKNKPIVNNGFLNDFIYDIYTNSYTAKIHKKKYKVTQPVIIKIPLNTNHQKLIESKEYFYFASKLNVGKIKNKKASEITLFWDNSLSQKNKKISSEIEFLDAYFNYNKDVIVNLVVFNFKVQEKKTFNIKDSNWVFLKNELLGLVYDGATSFDFLKNYKDTADENFVFSNGLHTLSNIKLNFMKTTHVVNSLISASHSQLKHQANNSGGYYINLEQTSIKDAILKIQTKPLQILGTNFSNIEIEMYPKVGSTISENFSISGKRSIPNKTIEIYLGYNNDTLSTVHFELKKNNWTNKIVQSLWAQAKLTDLSVNLNENEEEVVELSKNYNVISPFTSLVILDRIEDYVIHEIVPPKELQKKYYELLSQKRNNKKETLLRLKQNLENEFNVFSNWINNKQEKNDSIKTINNNRPVLVNNSNIDSIDASNLASNEIIITGLVNDASGSLPGVSVIKKGTNQGVETNFDGRFSLIVERGDVLVFSYIGYTTIEHIVRSNNNIVITLIEEANTLDEVVVIAFENDENKLEKIHEKKYFAKIDLQGWNPETPYLKVLQKIENVKLAYNEYLMLREKYGKSPSFFIDVADYFKEKNEFEIAKLILTNVAEIDLSNYELLKALAYKFEEYRLWDYAVFVYEEIALLRPEDIQSYRDLALAYENIAEYQKSLDLLYRIVKGEFLEKDLQRRFRGVEVIALQELNRLITLYSNKVDYSYIDKKYLIESAVDVRVVIDWNHNDTDIDLWVFEPNGEKCFYQNKNTKIGGLMSDDMTRGFGPEHYILKKAEKGNYKINVNYYGDSQQKISGPTFLKVTTFVNYGKQNELKKTRLIRLSSKEREIHIGELSY